MPSPTGEKQFTERRTALQYMIQVVPTRDEQTEPVKIDVVQLDRYLIYFMEKLKIVGDKFFLPMSHVLS